MVHVPINERWNSEIGNLLESSSNWTDFYSATQEWIKEELYRIHAYSSNSWKDDDLIVHEAVLLGCLGRIWVVHEDMVRER